MSQRIDRVDELLRQEIGALLQKEVADPRIGFATITDVETSPDLGHARVWVSVIGEQAEREETLRALQRAMGYVRHELGRRLRIRRIPELHVRLDDSAERGTRVLHLLNELEAGREPAEILPFDESLPTPLPRLPHEGDTAVADEADGVVDAVDAGPSVDGAASDRGPAVDPRPSRREQRPGPSRRARGGGRPSGRRTPRAGDR